ncbi:MAG: FAD-dependent oxidoreductase [Bacteriovoracaceae bacterium]
MNKNQSKKILIVGAGLVGTLQAIYCRKLGFQTILVEKRKSPESNEFDDGRSINLVLTSRGVHALKELSLWGKVKEIVTPVYGRMVHSIEGECTFQSYGPTGNECNYSVNRNHLNRFLIQEAENAGVEIRYEAVLQHIDFTHHRAKFNSFTEEDYDLFIGADGAGSTLRHHLVERGQIKETVKFISSGYKELSLSPDQSGEFEIEGDKLHLWPRGHHFLMALPNVDKSFTLTLYLPHAGKESFDDLESHRTAKKYFEKYYSDILPKLPNLEEEFETHPVGKLGTVWSTPWNFDRYTLIGDAAHAIVPFFGQGCNAGFEDCFILNDLLSDFDWSEDISVLLQKFYERRKPNADAIADMALDNFIEMQTRVANEKFLFKKEVEKVLANRFKESFQPRYYLVTQTLVPYVEAQNEGKKQEHILQKLCDNKRDLSEIDFDYAERLINIL